MLEALEERNASEHVMKTIEQGEAHAARTCRQVLHGCDAAGVLHVGLLALTAVHGMVALRAL